MADQSQEVSTTKVYALDEHTEPLAKRRKYNPSILPFKIHHNGPVIATERHWNPETQKDNTLKAHFRGRELRGRAVKLPVGYKGVVFRKTGRTTKDLSAREMRQLALEKSLQEQQITPEDYNDELQSLVAEDNLPPAEVSMMDQLGSFDHLAVWGHDVPPDQAACPFSKALQEWLEFATMLYDWKTQNP